MRPVEDLAAIAADGVYSNDQQTRDAAILAVAELKRLAELGVAVVHHVATPGVEDMVLRTATPEDLVRYISDTSKG